MRATPTCARLTRRRIPKICMTLLILHEPVLGHDLQLASAVELEKVPEFHRMSRYTAFGEG